MTIADYKQQLLYRDPCEEGLKAFNDCCTRRDFFRLVGQPVACSYFLNSIKEGWGPTPKEFKDLFRSYINGGMNIWFNINDRKLCSQVWCDNDDVAIDNNVRWLILIGCEGKVTIKNWQVVKIFVDKYSRITLDCAPNSIVYVENVGGVVNDIKGNCKFKTI